mgnify:CR=1 FL=1
MGFMPSPGNGAIGSVNASKEERKYLAKKSNSWECPKCGIKNSEALPPEDINEVIDVYEFFIFLIVIEM